ncbi:MAG: NUDIX hydrolase [Psychroflexus sp.]|uniref:NUDIX hydrolase n=1 Tax=Psychroflexus sp. S27 TaxID=1982757 RepID=UPI000C296D6C|nr:NUDIX domain-containing protein [Psychroflexus sp. S27]PJX28418.1 NUDIX hydrolase [Psychroflexus sp. S27]
MYKVFINDVPIILSTDKNIGAKYTSISIKKAKIKSLIKKVSKGEIEHLHLYHKKEHKLLKHLKKKLKVIVAGGGLVRNPDGKMLFIYRNKKWDLPKGKAEKGETIEETSIREVEEETGVENLKIGELIKVTYHILKRKGKFKLKETHWFAMTTDYAGDLIPQEDEGITKVKWKNKKKAKKALKKSYENIRLLFPDDFFEEEVTS